MIRPGEIYFVNFEEAGPHPVLIVSREELNRGRTVVVAFITSARFELRSTLPNCVPIPAGRFGLTKNCVVQCENIVTVGVEQLDASRGPVGKLDHVTMREVVKAIGYVVEASYEPE